MSDPAVQSVTLPAIFDLDAIDAVRDRLLEAIEVGSVRVAAGAVERVATNALFMLLSAARTAERNGYGLMLASTSPTLAQAIERLGLAAEFDGMEGN